MPGDFGVFAPVFESAHGYLALLRLSSADCVDAVRLVRRCASADVDRADELGLLGDLNWRPTLVAAVAALFLPPDPRIATALWRRFDAGSWVVPQIAVVLSEVDPDFLTEARRRLEAHCPLDCAELQSLAMAERHTAAGPEGSAARSAKAAGSLQAVVSSLTPPPGWLSAVLASPDHQDLVSSDMDSGGRIALEWSGRMKDLRQQFEA
ncbi:MAG: hypothetical protein J0L73_24890 [Verrucomicrobia bacterium]|nr:hypothetical protein [Verrucomicrobiota bacterium]